MADKQVTDTDLQTRERVCAALGATTGMSLKDLRELKREEIVRRHDLQMDPSTGFGALGPEDYRNELIRRDTETLNRRLHWLTVAIFVLTAVLVVIELWRITSGE